MSHFRLLCAALLLAAMMETPAVHAAESAPADFKIKIDQLMSDTQKTSSSTDTVDLVWWIPPQFWASVLADNADVPDKTRAEIEEIFAKYTVVAAVKGSIGNFGVDKFASDDELRAQLRLVDPHGNSYAPIAADKLDSRLVVLIQVLKPLMASVVGQMGTNLNFYAFPAKTQDGKPVADPFGAGKLAVKLGSEEYAFRLPLGSLLPPRHDPASREVFPGSYRYNPYTGAALQVTPASAAR